MGESSTLLAGLDGQEDSVHWTTGMGQFRVGSRLRRVGISTVCVDRFANHMWHPFGNAFGEPEYAGNLANPSRL